MTHPLSEIEERTGSAASTLAGYLADHGNPTLAACPDEIASTVASSYALTECGRLFHWRYGDVRELKDRGDGYFVISVAGVIWAIRCRTLLDRVFPDRKIEDLADDPLAPCANHDRPAVIDRCSSVEYLRGQRLLFGEAADAR